MNDRQKQRLADHLERVGGALEELKQQASWQVEIDTLRRVTQLQADNMSFIISLLDTEDGIE